MLKLKGRFIHLDGWTIGFQFNKQSLGKRCLKRNVAIDESGQATILFQNRVIPVCRLFEGHDWHWEAYDDERKEDNGTIL